MIGLFLAVACLSVHAERAGGIERRADCETAGVHEARNPLFRWRIRFDGTGFLVEPDARDWTWGLALERYGFAGREVEVARPARVSTAGERVAYTWDASLVEWYENEARGLEHGYTVRDRPPRDGSEGASALVLTLAVRGGLRADVDEGGRRVRFLDESGAVALTYTGLAVFDAGGRAQEASFRVDASGRLLLAVDERGARYPLTIDPIAQEAYLKASNTDAGDELGSALAISGDTVVVGAWREDSNATGVGGNESDDSASEAGAAYVFVRGTGWSQEAYLKASNTGADDRFGWSVAVSGDILVVGAPREASSATGVNGNQGDDSAYGAGAAYVFVRSGTTWAQQAYLKAANAGAGDEFGSSVAVAGDTVVIGAPFEGSAATGVNGNGADDSASNAGAAYVFVRSGTTWSQQAYLKAANTDAGDELGWSVAVSGDTAVVGARWEDSASTGVNGNASDNSASYAGAAYVFFRVGTNWGQQAYLKASNTDEPDEFGHSVAVSGDTVVVGAWREASSATGVNGDEADDSAGNSGAAYVFARSGASWSQTAYLKASNADPGDEFGWSVAVSGDRVAVGAGRESSQATGVNGDPDDNSAPGAGAAYLFERASTSWSQTAYLKASNTGAGDELGRAVALSNDTVVVGASREQSDATGVGGDQGDDSLSDAGAAYVFRDDPGPGSSYCLAAANSTGGAAHIAAGGSASLAAASFALFAHPVPAGQNGIFFYGPAQAQVPFGNGFLCVAPGATGIARLPVVQANALEVMTHRVDFSAPPTAATQITAGSTWNFQAWFRDPAVGPAFFNLSDGLSVTFGP